MRPLCLWICSTSQQMSFLKKTKNQHCASSIFWGCFKNSVEAVNQPWCIRDQRLCPSGEDCLLVCIKMPYKWRKLFRGPDQIPSSGSTTSREDNQEHGWLPDITKYVCLLEFNLLVFQLGQRRTQLKYFEPSLNQWDPFKLGIKFLPHLLTEDAPF